MSFAAANFVVLGSIIVTVSASVTYQSMEDALLLQGIARGEQQAFSELFSRHRAKLYDYLYAVTKSREIAEELLLDVFMKLWLGRELAPQIQHLDAFMQKVAHNKAINFLNTAARRKHLQKLVAYEMAGSVDNTAESTIAEKEYQELLQEALLQLSPQRRMVFTMSREQGLSHEEIARELQLSRQTVKNYMTDAIKTIRDFLSTQKSDQGLILIMLWMLC